MARHGMFENGGPGFGVGLGLGVGDGEAFTDDLGAGEGEASAAHAGSLSSASAMAHAPAIATRRRKSILLRFRCGVRLPSAFLLRGLPSKISKTLARDVGTRRKPGLTCAHVLFGTPLRVRDRGAKEDQSRDDRDQGAPGPHSHAPHGQGFVRAAAILWRMRKLIASLIASAILFIGATPANAATPPTPMAISAFATVLRAINPKLPDWKSRIFARHLLLSAAHWRLDATMLVALMTVESRWRTQAVSRAGAVGLGQLMPQTAANLHVNPRDPIQNISGSARYLGGLMDRFHRKRSLAIAAYNAGPQAVKEYGGIPPYYETQHYVVRVLRAWKHLKKTVRVPGGSELEAGLSRDDDVGYWSPNR
jgi:hypothetical protein